MSVVLRLKQLRTSHNYTQVQVAGILGITECNYRKLELQKGVSIKFKTLEKLCKLFNCTPNDLICITE